MQNYASGMAAGAMASFVVWVIGWGVSLVKGVFKHATKV
jgi:hypothetical protein